MGGSMGSVVGEKVTRAAEQALARRIPLLISPGLRRRADAGGLLSLMQMAKTAAALGRLARPACRTCRVLTDPPSAG